MSCLGFFGFVFVCGSLFSSATIVISTVAWNFFAFSSFTMTVLIDILLSCNCFFALSKNLLFLDYTNTCFESIGMKSFIIKDLAKSFLFTGIIKSRITHSFFVWPNKVSSCELDQSITLGGISMCLNSVFTNSVSIHWSLSKLIQLDWTADETTSNQ